MIGEGRREAGSNKSDDDFDDDVSSSRVSAGPSKDTDFSDVIVAML